MPASTKNTSPCLRCSGWGADFVSLRVASTRQRYVIALCRVMRKVQGQSAKPQRAHGYRGLQEPPVFGRLRELLKANQQLTLAGGESRDAGGDGLGPVGYPMIELRLRRSLATSRNTHGCAALQQGALEVRLLGGARQRVMSPGRGGDDPALLVDSRLVVRACGTGARDRLPAQLRDPWGLDARHGQGIRLRPVLGRRARRPAQAWPGGRVCGCQGGGPAHRPRSRGCLAGVPIWPGSRCSRPRTWRIVSPPWRPQGVPPAEAGLALSREHVSERDIQRMTQAVAEMRADGRWPQGNALRAISGAP